MISNLRVENFRSLENIDLPMAQLTAIVGPNGTGKTSALMALGLLLGEFWPSMRSVRIPQDFTRFDATRDLTMEVTFDPPLTHEDTLGNPNPVTGLRYTCKPYRRKTKRADAGDLHAEFEPVGPKGDPPMVAVGRKADRSPDFRPLRVTNDLRDQSRVLVIDHRRSVLQHLPSGRGSALGKLFETARKELDAIPQDGDSPRARFGEAYQVAMEAIRTPRVHEVEETIAETTKRMAGFLGTSALGQVEIGFGFADPANPLNSLRLMYREGGLEIPADELGLGIQSALVVGIFDALRRLGGQVGTLIIEEPEMYLHPQAQRYFHKLLAQMADDDECQVIYSTHSPIFADITRFSSIRLMRKEPGGMSTVSRIANSEDEAYLAKQHTSQKLAPAFDAARSEMLFARRALLVEGHGDRVAVLDVAARLGYDPDAEDLAVVMCGSKSTIPFFARVCKALEVPCFILHDGDVYPIDEVTEGSESVEKENLRSEAVNSEIRKAAGDDSHIFVVQPSLEVVLGISRKAKDKPKRIAAALQELSLDDVPTVLRSAVEALFAEG